MRIPHWRARGRRGTVTAAFSTRGKHGGTGAGDVPARECLHDARSEPSGRRSVPRISGASGSRMVAASDARTGIGRIPAHRVSSGCTQDRGPGRRAVDERPRNACNVGCPERRRAAGPVHRPQSAFAGDLPDGQSQSRARQQRRIVLRVCVPWHDRRTAFRELRGWVPVRPAWIRAYGTARAGSLSGPNLHGVRQFRHALDEARSQRPSVGAPRVRNREQGRRPHVCRVQLQQSEHEPARSWRCVARHAT